MRATISTALALTVAILTAAGASAATVGLTITILPTAVASFDATPLVVPGGAAQAPSVRQGVAALDGGSNERARVWSAADNLFVGFNYQRSEAVCDGTPDAGTASSPCRTVVTLARL